MSKLLDKHFFDISSKVTSSFYESASPVLKRAEEDMQRLHNQGESTVLSQIFESQDLRIRFRPNYAARA